MCVCERKVTQCFCDCIVPRWSAVSSVWRRQLTPADSRRQTAGLWLLMTPPHKEQLHHAMTNRTTTSAHLTAHQHNTWTLQICTHQHTHIHASHRQMNSTFQYAMSIQQLKLNHFITGKIFINLFEESHCIQPSRVPIKICFLLNYTSGTQCLVHTDSQKHHSLSSLSN